MVRKNFYKTECFSGASGDGQPHMTEDLVRQLFLVVGLTNSCTLKKGSEIGGPFASLVRGDYLIYLIDNPLYLTS